jgi:amino acid adenylation domain-containing protein
MEPLARRIAGLSPEKRQLLERLLQREGVAIDAPILPRPAGTDVCPLSFAQERLWLLHQLDPHNPAYNIPFSARYRGRLDRAARHRAHRELVRRHETARTTIQLRDSRPVQVIAPPPDTVDEPPEVDLRGLDPAAAEARLEELAVAEGRRPFDLAAGPLFRVTWVRLGEEDHAVLFTLHHVVTDGWSHRLLQQEFLALYEAFARGEPSPLPPLPVQYADYALWQRQRLQGRRLDDLLDYWKARLAGLPTLELPTDRPRPATPSPAGGRVPVAVEPALADALRRLGQAEGATLFMVLLAAFQTLLHRLSGQDDVVVGSPVANRARKEVEGLVGFFVNMLVLRTDLSGGPTFRALLARVKEACVGAYDHQELPFEKLVDELQPARDPSRNPLFQVVFALDREGVVTLERPGLTMTARDTDTGTAKFDLTLLLAEAGAGGLSGVLEYRSDLFDRGTAERLAGHFRVLLEAAAADPDRRVGDLPLLRPDEERRVLHAWNATDADFPRDACIHQLFEAQAARTPDAVALVFGDESWTYRELDERANRLAHLLRAGGVGPGVLVGVCLPRRPELVAALLGVFKAGGAYLPMDPSYPPDRLAYMARDGGVDLVLTLDATAPALAGSGARLVRLDANAADVAAQPTSPPPSLSRATDVAYVIHTSGSTGRSKGVVLRHRAVVNTLDWVNRTFGVGPADRVLFVASVCFDLSVYDVFGVLAAGGSVRIVAEDEVRDPALLVRLLCSPDVTFWDSAPAALAQLVPFLPSRPLDPGQAGLRLVFLSGDWIPVPLPDQVRAAFPGARVIALGGATEAAIWSNCYPVGAVDPAWPSIPYGKPIQNARYHVLDRRLRPVPVGVAGDLYIGGECLACGYHNRPALTAEKFIPDPFTAPGARLYRTGDRARYLADGNLEFLGRADLQVKIRGYRVEPGEVEAALAQHPDIAAAAVAALEEQPRQKRLVAYYVPRPGAAPALDALRAHLRRSLPEYMVPAAFVALAALPLTANGKLDRKALPAPAAGRPELGKEFVAPRNDLEELIAAGVREVLGLERVGVHDSFFELGGDSLKGAVLINRLQTRLEEPVYVMALFDAPTVAALADYLEREYPRSVARALGRDTPDGSPAGDAPVGAAELGRFRQLAASLRGRWENGRNGAEPRNRPAVFILSPPRSGSTLLRVMLAGHPRLFAPPELDLLTFPTLAQRRAAFAGTYAFRLEGVVRAVMELQGCDAAAAEHLIAGWERAGWSSARCYGQLQEWLGDRVLVDKTPSYSLEPAVLRRAEEQFDGPLFVHLLRHPCGTVQSFEDARLDLLSFRGEHPFTRRQLAELFWLVGHQNILDFLQGVPAERQLTIRFEELVRRPEAVLRGLCDFLGLDYEPAMADPYRDQDRRMTDGVQAGSPMLGDHKFYQFRGIDPGVADRWLGQVAEESLGAPTRELAAALGYAAAAHADGNGNGYAAIRPLSRDGSAEETLSRLDELSDEEVDALLDGELAGEGADG